MKSILKIVEALLSWVWFISAWLLAIRMSWDLADYSRGRNGDPIVWIGTVVLLLLIERILKWKR